MFQSKTRMKNLGTQAGFDILELGDIFYLLLPKEPTARVIISAHGGHKVLSGTNRFTVPTDTILRFYSDDTRSVLDPGFNAFYRGEAAPKEVVSDGERCFDYVLSKYQGRHGNKSETYDSIANVVNGTVDLKRRLEADAQRTGSPVAKSKMLNAAHREKVAAVLTVRNRWFKEDATLSKVIAAVKVAAPQIVVFDCLFCRSTLFGGSDAVPIVGRH